MGDYEDSTDNDDVQAEQHYTHIESSSDWNTWRNNLATEIFD